MIKSLKTKSTSYTYSFTPDEIKISFKEIAELLGYSKSSLPRPIEETIKDSMKLIGSNVYPAGGFVILNPDSFNVTKNKIFIDEVCLQTENIITRYFKNAETIAILIATIGKEMEILSKTYMNKGDLLTGYVLDVAASELVEKTIIQIEMKLEETIRNDNLKITNRYSPGYCGWNVSDQQKLFSFLPDNFCGVQLTDSSLMIPIKSISAIVGIGRNVQKKEYECEICDIDFCYKRDKKKTL
jgi:hypothetical protein